MSLFQAENGLKSKPTLYFSGVNWSTSYKLSPRQPALSYYRGYPFLFLLTQFLEEWFFLSPFYLFFSPLIRVYSKPNRFSMNFCQHYNALRHILKKLQVAVFLELLNRKIEECVVDNWSVNTSKGILKKSKYSTQSKEDNETKLHTLF